MNNLISVAEARATVLEYAPPGDSESVPVRTSVGRVLSEPVVAAENVPPFDNSAMDGYAVRIDDFDELPVELEVIADIPAGSTPDCKLLPGSCARIMTGAMVPSGSDAVVPVEWTNGFQEVGARVTIRQAPEHGRHIRRAGDDIRTGSEILRSGTRIKPSMVGSIASLGYGSVNVATRPTVSVVATGSELIDVDQSPRPGQIRNSNGPALRALAEAAGARVIHELVATDDFDQTTRTLETAAEADLVLVSGGVSVGARDFVKDALEDLGVRLLFWRVLQRPGKPLAFGVLGDKLVFGLPGNPVSSTVCFYQYVYPAIASYLGMSTERILKRAKLSAAVKKAPGLYHFIPGRTSVGSDGLVSVGPSGPQGSHVYSAVAAADCLIHLDAQMDAPPPVGTIVNFEPLPC